MAKEKKEATLDDVLKLLKALHEKVDALQPAEASEEEEAEEEGEEAEDAEEAEEGEESEEETEEKAEEEEEEGEPVDLPDKKGIKALKGKALKKVAAGVGIVDTDEMEEQTLRDLLLTVHDLANDNTDDLDKKKVNALAKVLSIDIEADMADTIKSLQEYLGAGGEEEAEEGEAEEGEEAAEETEEESEESEEEEKAEEEEEEEAEEVSPKEQKNRLAAYNKVAKKKLEKYSSLEKLLTGDDETVAEWGVPYVKNEEGYCCGLPLIDVKGSENVGKCQVTNARYKFDGENFKKLKPVAK